MSGKKLRKQIKIEDGITAVLGVAAVAVSFAAPVGYSCFALIAVAAIYCFGGCE